MSMQSIGRTTMTIMKIIVMIVGTITIVMFLALAFLAGRINVGDTVWDLKNRAVLTVAADDLLASDSTRTETASITKVLADGARRERGGAPPDDAEDAYAEMIGALDAYAAAQAVVVATGNTPNNKQEAAIAASLVELDDAADTFDDDGFGHTASGLRGYTERLRLLENKAGF